MRLSYVKLFSVSVPHEYYTSTDGLCPDLEFVPTPETKAAMEHHRLRYRSMETGFEVYFEADGANDPLAPNISSVNFRFGIKMKNARFDKVTTLPALGYREMTYFFGKAAATNMAPSKMLVLPLLSTFVVPVTPLVTSQDIEVTAETTGGSFVRAVDTTFSLEPNATEAHIPIDGRPYDVTNTTWSLVISSDADGDIYNDVSFRFDQFIIDGGFFGMLEISSAITAAAAGEEYTFNFGTAASTTWDYFIVKRAGTGSFSFDEQTGTYAFNEDGSFDPNTDAKATEVLAGQPDTAEVFKFQSAIEIPYSQTPLAIELLEGSTTVVGHLPNVNVNSAKSEVVVYV